MIEWEVGAALMGLVIGSFANVCIHRLPLEQSIVTPRSRCPACRSPIRAIDNVPILSYLVLLGRCRVCRTRISPRYPMVEIANGLGYLAIAATRDPSPRAVLSMAFLTALIILSIIDLEHYLLPNAITIPGAILGMAASFVPGWPLTVVESVASAVGGYAAMAAFATFYRRLRGVEALGQGDWKMVAMLGAFLGWRLTLLTLFMASLGGALVGVLLVAVGGRSFQQRLPLGTFLGLAGIVVLFVGRQILEWYGGFFRG